MANINTTIINGELVLPSSSSVTVSTSSQTFWFKGDDGFDFNRMTVNGNSVTPQLLSSAVTVNISTSYSTHSGSTRNLIDGSTSTYWWGGNAQTAGQYVLFTFSRPITLKSFSTTSSHSRDYPKPNNVLQVSSDNVTWTTVGTFQNAQTSTFTGITNARNVRYARIYATSSISNWLYLNEVSYTYDIEDLYQYVLTNISSDVEVRIVFGSEFTAYIKAADNRFVEHTATLIKGDGGWNESSIGDLYIHLKNKDILFSK